MKKISSFFIFCILTIFSLVHLSAANSQIKASKQKTILVTGGAGFLGSHMCKRLIEKEHRVICLDNLSTGYIDNINNLLDHPNFKFIEQNIQEPIDIDENLDEIYNFASPASPPQYQLNPIETLKTNVLGAINILEIARKKNAKIFQASTSEVYGDPLSHPQKESYWGNVNPIGIRSCYDESKRCCETLFFDYHRKYNLKIKVARIFNTYGPNMDVKDGRVVSNFITQAIKNEPITIHGSGEQTRSFCYVDDLLDAIDALMESEDDFLGPINIGNSGEFTILELASKVIKLTNSNSQILYLALPLDDPKQRRPDLSLANVKLNWAPKIQLEEGLKKTLKYFDEKINAMSY